MRRRSLILCVAALAGFAALYAQDQSDSPSTSGSASTRAKKQHGWARHDEFGYLLKQLNLTDAQKQQLKLYVSDNRPTFRTNLLNLLRAKQAVDSVIEKNPSDDATIRSLSTNVGSFETELAAQRAKFEAFLQSILTSEHRETLIALQQKNNA
jgi:Spy/CpxP family protein refolding chaperone